METLLTKNYTGSTNASLNCMESARLSLREETHPVACISVSITRFIRASVKRMVYQSIIGPFHGISGKPWRTRKRQKSEVD